VTEDKLIVGIPLVVSMRVVGVELEPTSVLVQVEQVRIAIAVGYVYGTINATAFIVRFSEWKQKIVGCILRVIENHQCRTPNIFLFWT
jgi:hypothetical protein